MCVVVVGGGGGGGLIPRLYIKHTQSGQRLFVSEINVTEVILIVAFPLHGDPYIKRFLLSSGANWWQYFITDKLLCYSDYVAYMYSYRWSKKTHNIVAVLFFR